MTAVATPQDTETEAATSVSATDTPVAETSVVDAVAARALRSGGVATFEALRGKPRRVSSFSITLPGEDGDDLELTIKYQALTSRQYDELVAACPPSRAEQAKGAAYNADTFAPKLIAAVSLEPKLTEEQAAELYNSENWSGGEITTLFVEALKVCNAGLDVPFTARG